MAEQTPPGVLVVFAPAGQAPVEIVVPAVAGLTLADAVRASGMLARFPQLDLAQVRLGVWGKPRDAAALVGSGDRVEIYRALIADPKASRSLRAKKKKSASK